MMQLSCNCGNNHNSELSFSVCQKLGCPADRDYADNHTNNNGFNRP